MFKNFAEFYGIDWLAMVMSLLFLYLIGEKKKSAFWVGIIGNIAWIVVNFFAGIWPGVILNIILIFLNIRGYQKWKK
jgi:nicotinamide riboside transporter PnuC